MRIPASVPMPQNGADTETLRELGKEARNLIEASGLAEYYHAYEHLALDHCRELLEQFPQGIGVFSQSRKRKTERNKASWQPGASQAPKEDRPMVAYCRECCLLRSL